MNILTRLLAYIRHLFSSPGVDYALDPTCYDDWDDDEFWDSDGADESPPDFF